MPKKGPRPSQYAKTEDRTLPAAVRGHANPYRYLEIRGDAEVSPDEGYSFADRVGAKYDTNLRDHDQPGQGRVIVTIRPGRVNAVDMSA